MKTHYYLAKVFLALIASALLLTQSACVKIPAEGPQAAAALLRYQRQEQEAYHHILFAYHHRLQLLTTELTEISLTYLEEYQGDVTKFADALEAQEIELERLRQTLPASAPAATLPNDSKQLSKSRDVTALKNELAKSSDFTKARKDLRDHIKVLQQQNEKVYLAARDALAESNAHSQETLQALTSYLESISVVQQQRRRFLGRLEERIQQTEDEIRDSEKFQAFTKAVSVIGGE